MAKNTVTLKLTSTIAVQGEILKRGQLVEVSEGEAQSLLHRGKAELATVTDEPDAEDEAPKEPEDPAADPATAAKTTGKKK